MLINPEKKKSVIKKKYTVMWYMRRTADQSLHVYKRAAFGASHKGRETAKMPACYVMKMFAQHFEDISFYTVNHIISSA